MTRAEWKQEQGTPTESLQTAGWGSHEVTEDDEPAVPELARGAAGAAEDEVDEEQQQGEERADDGPGHQEGNGVVVGVLDAAIAPGGGHVARQEG
jgi:hypothetical protein